MLNIFDYTDYLLFLKKAIDVKRASKKRPPSLRSIATKIDISVAYLSKVLNKKQALSTDAALKLSDWLELSPIETEYLILLLKFAAEKKEHKKVQIEAKINAYAKSQNRKDIEPNLFEKIASKNHIVTLLLMAGKHKSIDPLELSKLLGLEIKICIEILETLEKCQLVVKERNKYQRVNDASLVFQSKVPNSALRSIYKEMLLDAIEAIDGLPMESRTIGSEIVLIDADQIPKVQKIIEDCFTKVIHLSNQATAKDQAYSLGIQLIKLTKNS